MRDTLQPEGGANRMCLHIRPEVRERMISQGGLRVLPKNKWKTEVGVALGRVVQDGEECRSLIWTCCMLKQPVSME